MAVMVATERHLWVNLADIGEKEKLFLLDTPVSPSELFGTSIETVVHKFREARAHSAAYESFIPRRSASKHRGGPNPSWSAGQKQGQVVSVATRGPPPPRSRSQRRRQWRFRKGDLRDTIQHRRGQPSGAGSKQSNLSPPHTIMGT